MGVIWALLVLLDLNSEEREDRLVIFLVGVGGLSMKVLYSRLPLAVIESFADTLAGSLGKRRPQFNYQLQKRGAGRLKDLFRILWMNSRQI